MSNERVVFLSANIFGMRVLEHLEPLSHTITDIVTLSPDSKVKMYDAVELGEWEKFKLPVHYVKNQEDTEIVISDINPVLVVMCGWRLMLSEKILNLPRMGVVGFHPTLLPKGRGPAPIINSILEGWTESGVTMFYLSHGVDSGDIIGQRSFSIKDTDTAEDIYHKVINVGKILTEDFLPKILAGTAPRIPQDESLATYFKPLTLRNNEILAEDSVEIITRKIRALTWPYNGAFVRVGNKRITIHKGEISEE